MKSHAELPRAEVSYVWVWSNCLQAAQTQHNPQGIKDDEIHTDLSKPRMSHV
jgi:hypothetical protein